MLIRTNLLSIHLNLLSTDVPFKSKNKTYKFVYTIGYHRNNYIIEGLGHSWGTPLKNCFGAVFEYEFNKASNYFGNLVFSRR
jgi:hypothetical protein